MFDINIIGGHIFEIHSRSKPILKNQSSDYLTKLIKALWGTPVTKECFQNSPFSPSSKKIAAVVIEVVLSDVAWSGQNNNGCTLVAAATPVLYSVILMKIGVECSPSSSTHRPILDFTLFAHSPDTAVHS